MKVAISMREDEKHGQVRTIVEDDYVNYLERFGFQLLIVHNSRNDVREYLDRNNVEGIILSGGNDVDPQSWGAEKKEGMSLAPNRDKVEKEMLDYAIEKGLPVLGECRGMHQINVYFGGSLIEFKEKGIVHPVRQNHPVEIVYGQDYLGQAAMVNTYHGWGIDEQGLAQPLKAFAIVKDNYGNLIEGIYHSELPIAAITWHPERESPDEKFNEKIIKAFIERKLFWGKDK